MFTKPIRLRLQIAVVAVVVASVAAGTTPIAGRRDDRTGINKLGPAVASRIDALVRARAASCRLLNIAVVDSGKTVFSKAYGEGRLKGEYEYGSVSKPVTSTIIMQLRREGLIDSLDDLVSTYLPRYAGALPDAYKGSRLTIRHLLTHRSGIPHNDQPPFVAGKFNLQFAPGTQMLYSTPGYGVLGEVIQAGTEMPYSDAVGKYVGAPVGASSMHARASYIAPGAFVLSTIEDMARFAIGVMNNRYMAADVLYKEVLRPETGTYGLGWQVDNRDPDDLTASHGGSNGLPRAYLLVKPRRKQAVVVLAELRTFGPLDVDILANDVLQALREGR